MSTFTGGCDPWGVPCPTHGADHWRNATDRLTAERDAAVARAEAAEAAVERVRNEVGLAEYRAENHISRTWGGRPFPAMVSVDNLRRALDGGEAT